MIHIIFLGLIPIYIKIPAYIIVQVKQLLILIQVNVNAIFLYIIQTQKEAIIIAY